MGTITYSSRFQPGVVATAASLDTAFSTVSSAWASLASANFRRFAGIKNENKASYHAVAVGGANIRTLTFSDAYPANYISVFSYPHSEVVDAVTGLESPNPGTVPFVPTFKIKNVQMSYDSISGNAASDYIYTKVIYVKTGAKQPGYGAAGPSDAGGAMATFTGGTVSSVNYAVTDAIACQLYVYIIPDTGTVGTRTVTNLSVWLTLELPHVSR